MCAEGKKRDLEKNQIDMRGIDSKIRSPKGGEMHKILESNGTYLPTSYQAAVKACQESESKKSKLVQLSFLTLNLNVHFSDTLTNEMNKPSYKYTSTHSQHRARGGPSYGMDKSIWPQFCEKMKKRY